MYTQEDLLSIIREHISKFDISWFTEKLKEFETNEYYSEEMNSIYIVEKSYLYSSNMHDDDDDEYNQSEGCIETEHKYNFRLYCSCYLPLDDHTNWGCYAFNAFDLYMNDIGASNNIDELSDNLVKEISEYLKDEVDVTIIHKFISKQLDSIGLETTLRKNILDNEIYKSILDDFLKLCTYKFYKKYEKQLTRYSETADYAGKLDFDLNQEELLSLLFITQRAGFFKHDHSTFLRFCLNHFQYKNRRGNSTSPTSLQALQKEYSNISSTQVKKSKQDIESQGLNSVISKLTSVIKNLK